MKNFQPNKHLNSQLNTTETEHTTINTKDLGTDIEDPYSQANNEINRDSDAPGDALEAIDRRKLEAELKAQNKS